MSDGLVALQAQLQVSRCQGSRQCPNAPIGYMELAAHPSLRMPVCAEHWRDHVLHAPAAWQLVSGVVGESSVATETELTQIRAEYDGPPREHPADTPVIGKGQFESGLDGAARLARGVRVESPAEETK